MPKRIAKSRYVQATDYLAVRAHVAQEFCRILQVTILQNVRKAKVEKITGPPSHDAMVRSMLATSRKRHHNI